MKFYLSSYQLGNCPEKLATMVTGNKRIGIIRNALDFSNDHARLEAGRKMEFDAVGELGLMPDEIDLRHYFGLSEELRAVVQSFDALWVVGGNAFLLRRAMRQSGFDELLLELSCNNPNFVYAGYSAGVCVLTPTLRGIHLADQPEIVPEKYNPDVIWEGLGVLPFCVAPHYRSDHPEAELIEQSVGYFVENKLPFVTLRDGEVLIIDNLPLSPLWLPHVYGLTEDFIG